MYVFVHANVNTRYVGLGAAQHLRTPQTADLSHRWGYRDLTLEDIRMVVDDALMAGKLTTKYVNVSANLYVYI